MPHKKVAPALLETSWPFTTQQKISTIPATATGRKLRCPGFDGDYDLCIPSSSSGGAYYALARAAEQSHQPWLAAIGRFLLGGIARTPFYVPNQPTQDRDYD